MIVCQNCKSQEPDGTIFCSDCGTQLLQANTFQTQKFKTGNIDLNNDAQRVNEISKDSGIWISLHLLESGHILAFSDRIEFTLGRLSDHQPIEPDVDLTPYKAFDNGVSRLHAVIRRSANNVALVDLGSSNGTYINGLRIPPNLEHPLRHGDIIALGKLKIQIVLP
ncbi:MAG: FHA domain-containing protein [Chloroflexi bacterium]|nr:FHA domain-containing protein [Chloroflexota bacterium]